MKKAIIGILVFTLIICGFYFLNSYKDVSIAASDSGLPWPSRIVHTTLGDVHGSDFSCLGGENHADGTDSKAYELELEYVVELNPREIGSLDVYDAKSGQRIFTRDNYSYYIGGLGNIEITPNLFIECIRNQSMDQYGDTPEGEEWHEYWEPRRPATFAFSILIRHSMLGWRVSPSRLSVSNYLAISPVQRMKALLDSDPELSSRNELNPSVNPTDANKVICSDGTWIGPYSINKDTAKVTSISCKINGRQTNITTYGIWQQGVISNKGSVQGIPERTEFYLKVSNEDVTGQTISDIIINFDGTKYYSAAIGLYSGSINTQATYQSQASFANATLFPKAKKLELELPPPGEAHGLIIEKRDKETNTIISGATFSVKREGSGDWIRWSGNGAVVLNGTNDFGSSAGSLVTDSTGLVRINNLPAGTYHIYETGLPGGYDLRRQPGYDSRNRWVDIGILQVSSTGFTRAIAYNYRGGDPGGLRKVDSVSKSGIGGIQFKIKLISGNPQGASGWVKNEVTNLYLDGSAPTYNNKSDSRWYTNNVNEAKVFVTDSSGFIRADGLAPGTYEIWEINSTDWYDIEANSGYDSSKDWRYCGTVTISANVTMNKIIENVKTRGVLDIEKVDSIYDVVKLAGAGFKLKAETCEVPGFTGWLKGNKDTLYKERIKNVFNPSDGDIYYTDSNGILHIEGIPYGTYHVYEVVMPEGYDMTKQDGYDAAKRWVDLGTFTISLRDNHTATKKIQYKNDKIVDRLTGFVWLDVPNANKEGIGDSAFDSLWGTSSDERRLAGVPVQLCVNDERGVVKTIATGEVTNGNGEYEFTKWSSDATATKKNNRRDDLYYWDLIDAFVVFTYDNTEYVCVDPFEGGAAQVANNSKAKEWILEEEKLDDRLLTGMSGENETIGRAQTAAFAERGLNPNQIIQKTYKNTDLSACGLTAYYNTKNYTVEYINLGLWNKVKPTFDIFQSIQYSKVKVNGYTYTYDYNDGNKGQLDSDMVPEEYKQTGAKTYGATVYPSDVEYTKVENPGEKELQMYVVYKIDITNTTNVHWKKIYDEYMMYINSLVNTYDSERFSICPDTTNRQSWKGSEYFGLWGSGTTIDTIYSQTQYDLNGEGVVTTGDKLSEGIAPGATKSVYIQFRANQSYLEKMLTRKSRKRTNE